MRLLVVDDNARLRQLLVELFEGARYTVDAVPSASDALDALAVTRYDLVLMELQLPDGDGSELLRRIRRGGLGIPVMIGSSVSELERKVEALDEGADDYLTKPFSSDELLARVRALLRRPPNLLNRVLSMGNVQLDLKTRALRVDGSMVDMPRREIAVLETLMRHRARLVEKRALEEAVYNFDEEVSPNAIEAAVSRVRKRLDNAGASIAISATRGLGYTLAERLS